MKIPGFGRLLETCTNVAIVVACAAVTSTVIARWQIAPGAEPQPFRPGSTAESLSGVDYRRAGTSLVLYVKSTCRFCTESMPFYKQLRSRAIEKGVPLIVVSPEATEITADYLAGHGVAASQIVSHLNEVVGTPTLVLVDQKGLVRASWLGLQDLEGQSQILKAIAG